MKNSHRTEVVLGGAGYFDFGQEYWFSFKYRYENWGKDSSGEIAPFQIHTRTSSWDSDCGLGAAVGSAPFLMLSQDDQVVFYGYKQKILWKAAIQKNKWQTITVHFKISAKTDGYVEAWKDGVKIGRIDGANSPAVDNCGKPMMTPYFKMGVYKWDWKSKTTQSSRRQLFIDALKIAKGSDGLGMVTSSTSPALSANNLSSTFADISSSPSDTLVAHWPMNAGTGSTVQDASGNGYTATLVNGAQFTGDGSVKFDGVNDYINAGRPNVSGKAMTISGWVWADGYDHCQEQACTIASKATGSAVQDQDIFLGTIKKGSKTRLRFRINADGATSTLTAKSGDVGEKSWVHVAAVFTGKRMRLYQNGVLVGRKVHKGSITLRNKNPLSIGGHSYDATFNPWLGKMSDMRIYNYALTKKEIAELAK